MEPKAAVTVLQAPPGGVNLEGEQPLRLRAGVGIVRTGSSSTKLVSLDSGVQAAAFPVGPARQVARLQARQVTLSSQDSHMHTPAWLCGYCWQRKVPTPNIHLTSSGGPEMGFQHPCPALPSVS